MTEERICVIPVIDGMASFMTGSVEVQVKEQIVRCRDCEHEFEEWGYPYCCRNAPHVVEVDGDGFCKWGKPRRKS
jgi:hypothetical protein